ncbi:sensor domain-containing diguanylate cyclase [Vibrio sp. T187]|uniref:diguanylate cyclase n=1 Tax=Vibrio TaxID=662 RepID=UPI0010C9E8F2|nr:MULTISPECIES: diguanylate cyclase [Vibrio]MBW3695927.1 sensor domain-containing diguanylate cyclase [Vibrio sp. T187]
MLNLSSKQWSINLLLLVFVLLAGGMIEVLHRNQIAFLENQSVSVAKKHLSVIRSKLEAAIVADIYVINSLSTLVTVNPDSSFSEWEKIAASVIREGTHVKVIGLAKDDKINFIYPLRGNERALGLDYRKVPEQWATVQMAKKIEQIFIAGPVNLVQGGRGLIARLPIFIDPPFNLQYWGVCSAVIDLDSLFNEVGVGAFEHKYLLGIRGQDSSGQNGPIFYGSKKIFDNAFATEKVNFPYGGWSLAVSMDKDILADVAWYRVYIVYLIGYPVLLLLVAAFMMIFRLYSIAHSRSLHDALTKLPNRRYFMYSLNQLFDHAKRFGTERFAVLNIDLDKFKVINDTYGHAAGDKVLIACAERIKNVLRSSDIVARIGGDEFLILLPRIIDDDNVSVINLELQKAICSTPVIYEQHLIYLEVSVGWATYNSNLRDVDSLLKMADEKMYAEKRGVRAIQR